MTDDLGTWLDGKLSDEEPDVVDAAEVESEGVEIAGVSGDEAEDAAAGEAFWSSLTPAHRDRAEGDQEYLDQLVAEYNADAEGEPEEADEDEVEGNEDDDPVPQTPADVIALAYAREADLLADGWSSVEEFLVLCASDARWWSEAAAEMGWPADARPTQRDLPASLGMAVVAAGVPGAKLVEDPLHRMRGGSKRRLW